MTGTYRIIDERTPHTAALLRHVFGQGEVPCSGQETMRMERAMLGFELLRLWIAGNVKLPVLVLAGDDHCGRNLFFRWLQEVVRLPMARHHWMADVQQSSQYEGLVVVDGLPHPDMYDLLALLNNSRELCLQPPLVAFHEHVLIRSCLAVNTPSLPPMPLDASFWVRELGPCPLPESYYTMSRLTLEWPHVKQALEHLPFLSRPRSTWWFHEDELKPEPHDLPLADQ